VRVSFARHIYAQVIDDRTGKTLVSASSVDKKRKRISRAVAISRRPRLSVRLLPSAPSRWTQQSSVDRGGYKYHGRVKALADAAREAGLKF